MSLFLFNYLSEHNSNCMHLIQTFVRHIRVIVFFFFLNIITNIEKKLINVFVQFIQFLTFSVLIDSRKEKSLENSIATLIVVQM